MKKHTIEVALVLTAFLLSTPISAQETLVEFPKYSGVARDLDKGVNLKYSPFDEVLITTESKNWDLDGKITKNEKQLLGRLEATKVKRDIEWKLSSTREGGKSITYLTNDLGTFKNVSNAENIGQEFALSQIIGLLFSPQLTGRKIVKGSVVFKRDITQAFAAFINKSNGQTKPELEGDVSCVADQIAMVSGTQFLVCNYTGNLSLSLKNRSAEFSVGGFALIDLKSGLVDQNLMMSDVTLTVDGKVARVISEVYSYTDSRASSATRGLN